MSRDGPRNVAKRRVTSSMEMPGQRRIRRVSAGPRIARIKLIIRRSLVQVQPAPLFVCPGHAGLLERDAVLVVGLVPKLVPFSVA